MDGQLFHRPRSMTRRSRKTLAACGTALAASMVGEGCSERGSTSGSTAAASAGPAIRPAEDRREVDAVAMAKALRSVYPLAREAQECTTKLGRCRTGAELSVINKCAAEYVDSLNQLKGRIPADADVTGCSLIVVRGVRRALEVAIHMAEYPDPDAVPAPPMSQVHEALRECTNRLFRFGSVSCRRGGARILEPLELLGQLGLRDDELPGPETFNKPRGGHVCLATERELDRATLTVR